MDILNDPAHEKLLAEEGYVILPLLEAANVSTLRSFYFEKHPTSIEAMYASAHSPDIAYRKEMSSFIYSVVQPRLEKFLHHIIPLGASFIAKGSGANGSLAPHQDWNIVDEENHRSFNLWVPLVDTSAHNGGIMVVPRSHMFAHLYRGPNISSAFEHVVESLWQNMFTLDIPAGHGLLYDHRLLHASGPNNTAELRLVAVMGIIEENAPMKFYYRNEGNVEAWNCDANFFLEGNPQEGPAGLSLDKTIPWDFPSFDAARLRLAFEAQGLPFKLPKNGSAKSAGWLTRIVQLFKG